MSEPTYEELLNKINGLAALITSLTYQLESAKIRLEEKAWDKGFGAGWEEAKDPGAFVNDVWDAETPNPYTQQRKEREL